MHQAACREINAERSFEASLHGIKLKMPNEHLAKVEDKKLDNSQKIAFNADYNARMHERFGKPH